MQQKHKKQPVKIKMKMVKIVQLQLKFMAQSSSQKRLFHKDYLF